MLSEKIMILRKQKGWSQEQLADQLGVSRQAVSKWESGMSVPDLDKVINMSNVFGVCTDYLLKDDIDMASGKDVVDTNKNSDNSENQKGRYVSSEEAEVYVNLVKSVASRIGFGVSLCIFSPISLIILCGLTEGGNIGLSENEAAGFGLVMLFVFVAAGVAILILNGLKLSKYGWLENEWIELDEQTEHILRSEKDVHEPKFRVGLTIGVVLCICGFLPMFLAMAFSENELIWICSLSLLFVFVGIGVFMIISVSSVQGAYQKLLQEGEYTKELKANNKATELFSEIYWCTTVAIYLGWSFATNGWHRTWIIWPIAGVLFAAVKGIIGIILKKKNLLSM